MMGEIKEHSFLHIVLKDWVPTLITVLIGGGLLTTLIPRCQTDFERAKAYESRRLAIAESTVKDFSAYILYWQRLRDIAHLETSRSLSKDEDERKKDFVMKRNEAVNALYSDLDIGAFVVPQIIFTFLELQRRYGEALPLSTPALSLIKPKYAEFRSSAASNGTSTLSPNAVL